MKFLADMGLSMTTVQALRSLGHEVVHLRELGMIRMPDDKIVDKDDWKAGSCSFRPRFRGHHGRVSREQSNVILFRFATKPQQP